MSNIKLNFEDLFESLIDEKYAVIKLDSVFPNYLRGQDIDLFCRDIEEVSRLVISFLRPFVNEKVSISINKGIDHVHIDLKEAKQVHFRFDLLGSLPPYKNVIVKPSLFDVVIESSVEKRIGGILVKVPNDVDEGLLRYIEYLEYIASRPDKIKHAKWILDKYATNPSLNEQFFLRAHHFLSIPLAVYSKKSFLTRVGEYIAYYCELLSQSVYVIKNDGLRDFFAKAWNRLFK